MPKRGFSSITMRDDSYEFLFELYRKLEPELRKVGITSFAGFITKMTCDAVEQKYGLKP